MPSLHVMWALLSAILLARRYRTTGVLYATLIAVSTAGIGEHCIVDLVAALP
ncbi:MAG TPA: phosphatase PAP2 family protein [Acidobacteriaceae bacterium]|nr:phosphatase PAP2 family protein [Acidobacteriaceae bacterium]